MYQCYVKAYSRAPSKLRGPALSFPSAADPVRLYNCIAY